MPPILLAWSEAPTTAMERGANSASSREVSKQWLSIMGVPQKLWRTPSARDRTPSPLLAATGTLAMAAEALAALPSCSQRAVEHGALAQRVVVAQRPGVLGAVRAAHLAPRHRDQQLGARIHAPIGAQLGQLRLGCACTVHAVDDVVARQAQPVPGLPSWPTVPGTGWWRARTRVRRRCLPRTSGSCRSETRASGSSPAWRRRGGRCCCLAKPLRQRNRPGPPAGLACRRAVAHQGCWPAPQTAVGRPGHRWPTPGSARKTARSCPADRPGTARRTWACTCGPSPRRPSRCSVPPRPGA